MTYLCIVRWGAGRLDALSATEYAALMEETAACDAELRRRGHLVAGWTATATAVVVCRRGGRADTAAEPVGDAAAALVVEARDLNAAVAIAARVPLARLGSVEVYAVRSDEAGASG